MARSKVARSTKSYSVPSSVSRTGPVVQLFESHSRSSASTRCRARVPLPTPPGPMRTAMKGSADKGSKKFCALLGTESPDPAGLGDGRVVHDSFGLHLADGGQRADEVVGAHLGHALFARGQVEELLERQLARLHLALHFGPSTTVRHRQTRRLNSLFLRAVRRSGSHVVRFLLCRDFCSGQRLIEIIAPSTRRVTQCGALGAGFQYGSCNVHKHGVLGSAREQSRDILGTGAL